MSCLQMKDFTYFSFWEFNPIFYERNVLRSRQFLTPFRCLHRETKIENTAFLTAECFAHFQ